MTHYGKSGGDLLYRKTIIDKTMVSQLRIEYILTLLPRGGGGGGLKDPYQL